MKCICKEKDEHELAYPRKWHVHKQFTPCLLMLIVGRAQT